MKCDMTDTCVSAVTHIGEKGFTYCAAHAACRRGYERCRKMRQWECALIKQGKPLPAYALGRKPVGAS